MGITHFSGVSGTDGLYTGKKGSESVLTTKVLNGSAVIDPASLADAVGSSHTVTVAGAALGDYVLVAAPYDLQGVVVTGYVSAAGTVTIRIQNESGSAVDLASGTWKVKVMKG